MNQKKSFDWFGNIVTFFLIVIVGIIVLILNAPLIEETLRSYFPN